MEDGAKHLRRRSPFRSQATIVAADNSSYKTLDGLITTDRHPAPVSARFNHFALSEVAKGDGKTDDVDAFRAAMHELQASGGGTLLLPKRTYLVNKAVFLVDNIYIRSERTTLNKTDGPYSFFVSLSTKQTGYGSGVRDVRANGIRFQGDFTTNQMVCGVALHHAQDVTIENCTFLQAQGTGHCIDLCGCERVTVRDCKFSGFNNYKTRGYNKTECIQLD